MMVNGSIEHDFWESSKNPYYAKNFHGHKISTRRFFVRLPNFSFHKSCKMNFLRHFGIHSRGEKRLSTNQISPHPSAGAGLSNFETLKKHFYYKDCLFFGSKYKQFCTGFESLHKLESLIFKFWKTQKLPKSTFLVVVYGEKSIFWNLQKCTFTTRIAYFLSQNGNNFVQVLKVCTS